MEMDEDAYDVAVAFTGAEELVSLKKKEGGSMCQALKELLKEEREEGREEGRDTLLQRQIKKKIAKGKKIEQIAEELEETVESIREYYDKLVV